MQAALFLLLMPYRRIRSDVPSHPAWHIWNRSIWTRHFETHRRLRRLRPKGEWITKPMPELRIVPQELWDRVKARQKHQEKNSNAIREALHRNARTGRSPKYLFSGLLQCGECGANYVMADTYRYGCASHLNRGRTVCSNGLRVARYLVESRLLEGVKRDLLSEDGIALFVQETSRLLQRGRACR